MTHQIVQSLRSHKQKVVTVGSSTGGEVANGEAGLYHDVCDMGFCDLSLFSPQAVVDNVNPMVVGLVEPDVYFGGHDRGT